ncbi:MAG TPA: lysophospholipid acyltransferase family protein [Tepidisphaeraceae bacterium]|nr:lysophospholipid acyltransferase family protein [Tepidisphaeraceae bacterium]
MTALPTFTRESPLYRVGRVICRLGTTLAFDLKTYGLENVPMKGGVLIVSNHQSYLDPVLLAVKVHRPASFLAKHDLFEGHKLFAKVITTLNAFPIRQTGSAAGAIKETVKRLQEGHMLIMFPEGGRAHADAVEEMQGGVGLIARQAGPTVKVVPAAIHGTWGAWNRYRKIPRPWPIRVKYGPPIDTSHLKASHVVEKVGGEIRRLFSELKTARDKE